MFNKWIQKITSKIATKIFLLMVSIVIIILVIQSFLYLFVIDDAQYLSKQHTLEKEFEVFLKDIKDKNYDLEYINLATKDYVKSSGNPVFIIREDQTLYNEALIDSFTNILTVQKNNQEYKIVVEEDLLSSLSGDIVSIFAVPISDHYYLALDIATENEEFSAVPYLDAGELILSNALIVDYQFAPSNTAVHYIPLLQSPLLIADESENISPDTILSFNYAHPEVDATTIYNMTQYLYNGETYHVITSSTITDLHDQLNFIAKFNFFVFFIGLTLAILLSKGISKTLSKPVVQLTENAKKMANLDFSEKMNVRTHDEIASLGTSLNTLSDQLEKSILTLKTKNEELEMNYHLKSIEEQRAKDLILNLSHELNTPLGIVSGFNEILADGINDKPPMYYYEVISKELDRMNTLITDMLELSVLESGHYQLLLEDVDVSNIINERLAHFKNQFEMRGITLGVSLTSTVAKANFKKIHQVVNNFISNASKYTDEQGEYHIYDLIKDDRIYYYFVNTASIDVEDVSILWEKFYRTKKSNMRSETGSGIGLSIAKEILSLHNSDYGILKGNNTLTFYFSLKRTDV